MDIQTLEDKPKEELEKINSFVHSGLNQEKAATWLIIKALAKGEKSWSELEKEVNLGTSTLSRKLKKMQKQKFVNRKIIPAFPPRTVYGLNKESYPKLIDNLVLLSRKIEIVEELTINNLTLNLAIQEKKKDDRFLKQYVKTVVSEDLLGVEANFNTSEEALHYLFIGLDLEILTLIKLMLSLQTDSPRWSTYIAMILMKNIVAIAKNLSITPEMKRESILVIDREFKEKAETLNLLMKKNKFAKIIRKKSPLAPVIESNRETEAFFSKS